MCVCVCVRSKLFYHAPNCPTWKIGLGLQKKEREKSPSHYNIKKTHSMLRLCNEKIIDADDSCVFSELECLIFCVKRNHGGGDSCNGWINSPSVLLLLFFLLLLPKLARIIYPFPSRFLPFTDVNKSIPLGGLSGAVSVAILRRASVLSVVIFSGSN